jgi:hypothetical protein
VHSAPFINSTTIIQIVAGIFVVLLCVIPLRKIYRKAGFSPWILLLWFIPVVGPLLGLSVLYIVAYSKWKVNPEGQKKEPSRTGPLEEKGRICKMASYHGEDRSSR